MKNLKQYCVFWIPYGVSVIGLFLLILSNEKADLHLCLNACHNSFNDVFFRYITLLGEWVPFVVCAGLLFYKYKAALLVLSSQLAAGLVVQVLKRVFNAPRPKRFFAENFPDIELPQVLGVHMHSSLSFPSGHTTAAFAFFFSLVLLTKSKVLQFLYAILAILTAYSRIYLSQHFANDVLVGSIIGVTMTIVCQYFIDRKSQKWYDYSLIKRS